MNLNGMGDWIDDWMSDGAPVDESVLDARDALAQGTADAPIYDARDAWASGVSVPSVQTMTTSNDWSFSDLIKNAGSVVKLVTDYQRQTVPGGGTIYTRIDPRTGMPITGGQAVMVGTGGIGASIANAFKNPMVVAAAVGVGVLLLAPENKRGGK